MLWLLVIGLKSSHDNSTAIGAGASSTAANQITLGSKDYNQDLYTFGDTYRVIYDDHDISHNILLKPWTRTDTLNGSRRLLLYGR